MDELSRMIARLETQRACLDFAAEAIAGVPGPVVELGLGKARTYDRLRHLFPRRTVYAFDLALQCRPELQPAPENVFLGNFLDTLPEAARRLGRTAVLAHVDIGTHDAARDAALTEALASLLDDLVLPGGLVLCDREMAYGSWSPIPLPASARDWQYFIYRTN
jgi:hypothetical protein